MVVLLTIYSGQELWDLSLIDPKRKQNGTLNNHSIGVKTGEENKLQIKK